MNLVATFSRFAKLRWQRLRAVVSPDFGDMGTAFGLDACLDSEPATTRPAVFMKKGGPEPEAPQQRLLRVDQRIELRARR